MKTLYVCENGTFREAQSSDVLQCAQATIARRYRIGSCAFTAPNKAREFLKLHAGALEHEVFGVIHLDCRHRLIAVEDLFRGTIDGASVYSREVVKSVLHHNAHAVILFHNHPSGIAEPSTGDEVTTHRLRNALALIDVSVLDHFIVGQVVYSFAEHGLL